MADRPPAVFVYGTLMPGQPRWPLMEPFSVSHRPATARGHLWDTGLGYPAARFDDGGADVVDVPGILVAIAPDRLARALAALDRVEGEGVLYRRVEVATTGGPAITYEWLGPTDGLLPLAAGWPQALRQSPPA